MAKGTRQTNSIINDVKKGHPEIWVTNRRRNSMYIKSNFTSEQELKETLDFIYQKSKEGKGFNGILEAAFNEVTIITAIHNIKSNKGANTPGINGAKVSCPVWVKGKARDYIKDLPIDIRKWSLFSLNIYFISVLDDIC